MTEQAARRRTAALIMAGGCLPTLAAVYQVAAVRLARSAEGASWREWAAHLIHSPWGLVLLGSEAVSFILWMRVLGTLPLGIAYPLTALGTVLTLLLAGDMAGQTVPPLAWLGTAAILGGAWLIVRPAR